MLMLPVLLSRIPPPLHRQMILTGCVAFARHVGPTRVEAELLPQCWEQVLQLPSKDKPNRGRKATFLK